MEPRHREFLVFGRDHMAQLVGVAETFDGGDVLPGFRLPLAELFA